MQHAMFDLPTTVLGWVGLAAWFAGVGVWLTFLVTQVLAYLDGTLTTDDPHDENGPGGR